MLAAEQKRDSTGDGQKYAYVAQAARPDSASKRKYFDDYLARRVSFRGLDRAKPWGVQLLEPVELTLPYLKPALDALPQIKSERKIFFVLGWLNPSLGATIRSCPQQVREFLNAGTIDKDLQLKILEVYDELDRTVKIRQRYP